MSGQTEQANDVVLRFAASAQEQNTTLRSISSALNQLDLANLQNSAMAKETTASAKWLASDTKEPLRLIKTFRVSENISSARMRALSVAA